MAEKGDSSSLRKKIKQNIFGSDPSEQIDGSEKSTSSDNKQEEGSPMRRKDSEETVDGPKKAAGSNDKQEEGDQGSAKRVSASFQVEKEALRKKKIKHDLFGSDSEELDGSGKGSNDIPEGERARFLNNEARSKRVKHDLFGSDSEEKDDSEGDGSNNKQEGDRSDEKANKRKLLDGSQDLTRPLPETKPSSKQDGSQDLTPLRETKPRNHEDPFSSLGSFPALTRRKLDGSQDLTPLPETKPRNQEDTSSSHGSFPAPTGNLIVNKTKTLIYKKSLTEDDMSNGRLLIPMESGRKFLPEPGEHDGINENIITVSFMDHNRQSWSMEVLLDELSSCYMLGLNWEAYVKQFQLEAGDMIFIYHDPTTTSIVDHCLIEYEKKAHE